MTSLDPGRQVPLSRVLTVTSKRLSRLFRRRQDLVSVWPASPPWRPLESLSNLVMSAVQFVVPTGPQERIYFRELTEKACAPKKIPKTAPGVPSPQRTVFHEHFSLTDVTLDALVAEGGGQPTITERFETFFDTPQFHLLNKNIWLRGVEEIGNKSHQLQWTLKKEVGLLFMFLKTCVPRCPRPPRSLARIPRSIVPTLPFPDFKYIWLPFLPIRPRFCLFYVDQESRSARPRTFFFSSSLLFSPFAKTIASFTKNSKAKVK